MDVIDFFSFPVTPSSLLALFLKSVKINDNINTQDDKLHCFRFISLSPKGPKSPSVSIKRIKAKASKSFVLHWF